jgi:hypothetical protein
MAALYDRVLMWLNKRGSATMKPTSFCDELMMRLASQAFEHSLCLSPEKPFNSHRLAGAVLNIMLNKALMCFSSKK